MLTAEVRRPDRLRPDRARRRRRASLRIVEEKDATAEQRAIREINAGIYAFDAAALRDALARLATDNAQGEEYLTDVVGLLVARRAHRSAALVAADDRRRPGLNDRAQLAAARRVLNDRLLDGRMRAGVTVVDPATTWVDVDVRPRRRTSSCTRARSCTGTTAVAPVRVSARTPR